MKSSQVRTRAIEYLNEHGGFVEDSSGRATAILAHAIGAGGSSGRFSSTLRAWEELSLITRQVNGKRTFRIELVDKSGIKDEITIDPTPIPEPIFSLHKPVVPEEPEPEIVETVPTGAWDATEAAVALWGLVTDYILEAGKKEDRIVPDEEVLARLAGTLEENQRFRTKIAVLQESNEGLTSVNAKHMKRINQLEAVIKSVTDPKNRVPDDAKLREIRQLMQPGSRRG